MIYLLPEPDAVERTPGFVSMSVKEKFCRETSRGSKERGKKSNCWTTTQQVLSVLWVYIDTQFWE